MTVCEAIPVDGGEEVLVKDESGGVEMVRKLFEFFRTPQDERLAAAGGGTGQPWLRAALLLLATVGNPFLPFEVVLVFQFLLPAAAGAAGAPFGRAATDGTIFNTFPGDGVGDSRGSHGNRRKGSHDDHRIDRGEQKSHERSGESFHRFHSLDR